MKLGAQVTYPELDQFNDAWSRIGEAMTAVETTKKRVAQVRQQHSELMKVVTLGSEGERRIPDVVGLTPDRET